MALAGCSLGGYKKTELQMNNSDRAANSEAAGGKIADKADNNDVQNVTNVPVVQDDNSNKTTPAPLVAPTSRTDGLQAASATPSASPKIHNRLVSWGIAASSGRKIDTIIIHSSYNAVGSDPYDLDDIIEKEWKPAGVSPHYVIDHKGNIYRLVKDENIAYHAGVSKVPDGRTNVNNFSIGIEIVETKSEGPSSAQYSSLNKLLSYLEDEYRIKYVLGHSDISPGRKTDPWDFSWSKIGGKKN